MNKSIFKSLIPVRNTQERVGRYFLRTTQLLIALGSIRGILFTNKNESLFTLDIIGAFLSLFIGWALVLESKARHHTLDDLKGMMKYIPYGVLLAVVFAIVLFLIFFFS